MTGDAGSTWQGVALLLVLIPALIWVVPEMWRMSREEVDQRVNSILRFRVAPDWMVLGTMRALPVVIVSWFLFALVSLIEILVWPMDQAAQPPQVRALLRAVTWIFLLFQLIALSVVLVNWPKLLVPPGMRHQSGPMNFGLNRKHGTKTGRK